MTLNFANKYILGFVILVLVILLLQQQVVAQPPLSKLVRKNAQKINLQMRIRNLVFCLPAGR